MGPCVPIVWDLSNATSAKHKFVLVSLVAGNEMPLPLPSPSPPAPPFAPTDLSVGAINTTSFRLTWTNPFDGKSPLTEATITLSSTDGSNFFPADTLTSHQFQGLIPNRQYQIEVVVSNAIGSSPPGNVSAMTLPLGKTPPPHTDLSKYYQYQSSLECIMHRVH